MFDVQIRSVCRRLFIKPAYKQPMAFMLAAFVFGNAHAGAGLQEKKKELSERAPQEQLLEKPEALQRDFNLIPLTDLPDLVVTLRAGATRISHGDEVELQVELKNVGDAPADFTPGDETSSEIIILHIQRTEPQESLGGVLNDEGAPADNAKTLAALSEPTLINHGDSVRETHTLTIEDDFVVGAHDICAVADPDDVVRERNEANNRRCIKLYLDVEPAESVTELSKQKLDVPAEKFPGPQIPNRKPAIESAPETEEEE